MSDPNSPVGRPREKKAPLFTRDPVARLALSRIQFGAVADALVSHWTDNLRLVRLCVDMDWIPLLLSFVFHLLHLLSVSSHSLHSLPQFTGCLDREHAASRGAADGTAPVQFSIGPS